MEYKNLPSVKNVIRYNWRGVPYFKSPLDMFATKEAQKTLHDAQKYNKNTPPIKIEIIEEKD